MQCWMYYRMEKPRRGNLNHCCVDCDTHFEVYNYGKLKNAQDIKVKLSSDIKRYKLRGSDKRNSRTAVLFRAFRKRHKGVQMYVLK